MWLRLPYPASAGEGVPYEWRHMIKTCSQVRLPASLRHLGGEGGSGDAAEEGKEKLLPPPPLGLDPTKASVTWESSMSVVIYGCTENIWYFQWSQMWSCKSQQLFSSIKVLNLTIAADLPMAALVRSLLCSAISNSPLSEERFRWLFVPIQDLYLVDSTMWRLLPRLAFMVTARVALKGLWVSFTHLVESRLPFLGGHQQFSLSIFQLEENKYKSEKQGCQRI